LELAFSIMTSFKPPRPLLFTWRQPLMSTSSRMPPPACKRSKRASLVKRWQWLTSSLVRHRRLVMAAVTALSPSSPSKLQRLSVRLLKVLKLATTGARDASRSGTRVRSRLSSTGKHLRKSLPLSPASRFSLRPGSSPTPLPPRPFIASAAARASGSALPPSRDDRAVPG
jgi:hypothetical protein